METSTGRKTAILFMENDKTHKKDANRHDSNFHGPMSSPSAMWSPFVNKMCLGKIPISWVVIKTLKPITSSKESPRMGPIGSIDLKRV